MAQPFDAGRLDHHGASRLTNKVGSRSSTLNAPGRLPRVQSGWGICNTGAALPPSQVTEGPVALRIASLGRLSWCVIVLVEYVRFGPRSRVPVPAGRDHRGGLLADRQYVLFLARSR